MAVDTAAVEGGLRVYPSSLKTLLTNVNAICLASSTVERPATLWVGSDNMLSDPWEMKVRFLQKALSTLLLGGSHVDVEIIAASMR